MDFSSAASGRHRRGFFVPVPCLLIYSIFAAKWEMQMAVSDDSEFSKAQGIGCLVSFVITAILLIVPKAIALWQSAKSSHCSLVSVT